MLPICIHCLVPFAVRPEQICYICTEHPERIGYENRTFCADFSYRFASSDEDDGTSLPYSGRGSKLNRVTTEDLVAKEVDRRLRELGVDTVSVQHVSSARLSQQAESVLDQGQGKGGAP